MAVTLRRNAPRLTLALLAAIATCGFIDRILMNVLVQPIKEEFGLSDLQIGLVGGLGFAVMHAVLGVAVARYAERHHRISLVWIGTIFWSIATAACGMATSFWTLLLARIGVGVGEAVGLPATHSVVSDCFPKEKRATAMSVMMLAPPVGAFLGSAVGAIVAQAYGWRAAFWVAAIPGVVLAALLALLVAEPERGRHDNLGADADTVPPLSAVLARIWNRRTLRHMLFGSTIASMVGFGLNAFMAAYLARRYGFSIAGAGVAAGLLTSFPATLGVLGSGWLGDRLASRDPRWYALIPAIGLIAATPLYMFAVTRADAWTAIGLLGACALVQYAYLGITTGMFQNMMHPRMRASSTSVTNLVYSLIGTGLGPVLVGALSDRFGGGAKGLELALVAVTAGYLWAAVHYLLAARHVRAELALPA